MFFFFCVQNGKAWLSDMRNKSKEYEASRYAAYRKFLYTVMTMGIVLILILGYYSLWLKIPSKIKIRAGMNQEINLKVPASGEVYHETLAEPKASIHVNLLSPVTMHANQIEHYKMDLKLFGLLPLKSVDIQVIQDKELIPAGVPIGIYVKTQGILIIDVGEFTNIQGYSTSPCKNILQKGDYILAINGESVSQKSVFMQRLQEIGNDEIILKIQRNNEIFSIKCRAEQNQAGEHKLGIWIRDNAQGVGTLTYLSEDGVFGALGHGINDVDTSTLMQLSSGSLYQTQIIGIRKGSQGNPGELTGVIDYAPEKQIGIITDNTNKGIFGIAGDGLMKEVENASLPIGLKQEVHTGPAQIICSIDGKAEYYDIEITDIYYESDNINRGIVLKITDTDLLELTGGIVQGMSGSPIIQDGKIIGAVTHVLVQDAQKGFGIFIENMLEH